MTESLIHQSAAQLWEAQQRGLACTPVRELIERAALESGSDSVSVAYRVQQINTERQVAGGARIVGRKIGLTSRAVQRQLGVDQPDFGALFDHMACGDGDVIDTSRTAQPKIEAEIAIVLDRDLPHEHHTAADILRATAFVLPALEIVGSRIAAWDIRLTDTIADNASSGLYVLGTRPVSPGNFDAVSCQMVMTRNGEQVSSGSGSECLGNPFNASIWLANTLSRLGTPLKAGDIVLTGALGPMVPVQPGDLFAADIEGLGRVRAVFSNSKG